jgi:hypothetical protein
LIPVKNNPDGTELWWKIIATKRAWQSKSWSKFIEQRRLGDERSISEDFRLEDIIIPAFRTIVLVIECF